MASILHPLSNPTQTSQLFRFQLPSDSTLQKTKVKPTPPFLFSCLEIPELSFVALRIWERRFSYFLGISAPPGWGSMADSPSKRRGTEAVSLGNRKNAFPRSKKPNPTRKFKTGKKKRASRFDQPFLEFQFV